MNKEYTCFLHSFNKYTLQRRHNVQDGISNHWCIYCLLNCCFRWRSKKPSKLCATGLCLENSLLTREFPPQRSSNVENVSDWWCNRGWSCVSLDQMMSYKMTFHQLIWQQRTTHLNCPIQRSVWKWGKVRIRSCCQQPACDLPVPPHIVWSYHPCGSFHHIHYPITHWHNQGLQF